MTGLLHPSLPRAAIWTALAAGFVLCVALVFEHGLGYVPCKLCLQQREGYWLAIPAAALAALAALTVLPSCVPRGLLLIAGLGLAASALLGVYHAGAEWSLWAGPADCGVGAMAAPTDAGGLLQQLERTVAPSCTDAPGRFLGLSFAGWNVLGAGAIGAWALWQAWRAPAAAARAGSQTASRAA